MMGLLVVPESHAMITPQCLVSFLKTANKDWLKEKKFKIYFNIANMVGFDKYSGIDNLFT